MRRADLQADARALFSTPRLAALAGVTKKIGRVRL